MSSVAREGRSSPAGEDTSSLAREDLSSPAKEAGSSLATEDISFLAREDMSSLAPAQRWVTPNPRRRAQSEGISRNQASLAVGHQALLPQPTRARPTILDTKVRWPPAAVALQAQKPIPQIAAPGPPNILILSPSSQQTRVLQFCGVRHQTRHAFIIIWNHYNTVLEPSKCLSQNGYEVKQS